ARASSLSSSQVANCSYSCGLGRGRPGGGIEPLRTFFTTFSQAAAEVSILSESRWSRSNPAVLRRSLWQLMQYLVRNSRWTAPSPPPTACVADQIARAAIPPVTIAPGNHGRRTIMFSTLLVDAHAVRHAADSAHSKRRVGTELLEQRGGCGEREQCPGRVVA